MNQVPEEKKEAVTKTLAIFGFVAVILLAVWLAVQIVSVIPSAFSSLASLADSVYNYKPDTEFKVSTQKSVVGAGEAFTLTWTERTKPGIYSFSYACVDGVAVDMRIGKEVSPVTCGEEVQLDTRTNLELTVASEKKRFTDIAYTVVFVGEDGKKEVADSKITIVNASIPTSIVLGEDNDDTEEEPEGEVAGESTSTPVPTPTPTPTPKPVEEIIYALPVSDPNGTTDLSVKYLGVGILDANKNFVPTGVINLGQTGAFQFEVKNLGTKTSASWTYEAKLPADIDYDSTTQTALKPNERAVITIGFTGLTQTGVERFGVTIKTSVDTSSINNSFVSAVSVR